MPTFVHDVKPLLAELNSKISALESKQTQIRSALERSVAIPTNTAALLQVTKSLTAAQLAKEALIEGCCDQGCNIDYQES